MKPLFGFRALMADLAAWIREHRMTLGFVLFITLFNVGMQLVCGIRHTQFPPQLSRVSFDALAHGAGIPRRFHCCRCLSWGVC